MYKSGNKLKFGKYKNQTIDSVIKKDPTYIEWCLNNIDLFELDETLNEIFAEHLSFEWQDDYEDYSWHPAYGSYMYGERD